MKFADRALGIMPSATLAITAKAKEMKKNGIDVISFGAGEPDFDTPDFIKNACKKSIDAGFTKYTPSDGIIELKDAIINKLKNDLGVAYQRDQVCAASGAKHALCVLFMCTVEPGDEVIVPAPYWVSYVEMIRMAGGKAVIIETDHTTEFKMTADMLKKSITKKTKAVILNSPSNPTGAVYSKEELKSLANVLENQDILIISDEIYDKLLYDGEKHISIVQLSEKLIDKTVIVNGHSKTYSMTGWRLGYAAGPKEIISLMKKWISHSTTSPTSFVQQAGVDALTGDQAFLAGWVNTFKERRDVMVEGLNQIEGIECLTPKGAFYVYPCIKGLLGKEFNGEKINSSMDLAAYLLEKHNVAIVPGEAFGNSDYFRMSFATSMENIKKGLERIKKALS
jgi:aspartate aminotransferase